MSVLPENTNTDGYEDDVQDLRETAEEISVEEFQQHCRTAMEHLREKLKDSVSTLLRVGTPIYSSVLQRISELTGIKLRDEFLQSPSSLFNREDILQVQYCSIFLLTAQISNTVKYIHVVPLVESLQAGSFITDFWRVCSLFTVV